MIPEFRVRPPLISIAEDQPCHYLSLYEFTSADIVDSGMAAWTRPGAETERATFHKWETTRSTTYMGSCIPRRTATRASRPRGRGRRARCTGHVQVRPRSGAAFSAWYESEYIPRLMADVPADAASRRYTSQGADGHLSDGVRLTGLPGFERALADMGAPIGNRKTWPGTTGKKRPSRRSPPGVPPILSRPV